MAQKDKEHCLIYTSNLNPFESIKIIYKGKEKTFFNISDANRFIGAHIPEMLHEMVTPQLYYEFNRFEIWDDNSEMTGEEWAVIVTHLLSNF